MTMTSSFWIWCVSAVWVEKLVFIFEVFSVELLTFCFVLYPSYSWNSDNVLFVCFCFIESQLLILSNLYKNNSCVPHCAITHHFISCKAWVHINQSKSNHFYTLYFRFYLEILTHIPHIYHFCQTYTNVFKFTLNWFCRILPNYFLITD